MFVLCLKKNSLRIWIVNNAYFIFIACFSGYSQVIPKNLSDLWVTMWSQVSGAIVFVFFIGNAITLMEELDSESHSYKLKLAQVSIFLIYFEIGTKYKRK